MCIARRRRSVGSPHISAAADGYPMETHLLHSRKVFRRNGVLVLSNAVERDDNGQDCEAYYQDLSILVRRGRHGYPGGGRAHTRATMTR